MTNALSRGWNSFVDGMADFAVALAYSWMWVILWAAIIAAAVLAVRKLRRRRAAKKAAAQAAKAEAGGDDKSGKP